MNTLFSLANEVLQTSGAQDKAELSVANAEKWGSSTRLKLGSGDLPSRPARPDKPELLHPTEMPRRRGISDKARAVLLHAVAHIELNAIDLAWDMAARFIDQDLPREFFDDWVTVGKEEGKHFLMLQTRLNQLGYEYGDFAAHDGLWQAAEDTSDDIIARLVIVPTVLEARGLDVTPAMMSRFEKMQDHESAAVLNFIYLEEIDHVKKGNRWFRFCCEREKLSQIDTWQRIVRERFKGKIKPPFNVEARKLAGLPEEFYILPEANP